jgi:hypothetical protein
MLQPSGTRVRTQSRAVERRLVVVVVSSAVAGIAVFVAATRLSCMDSGGVRVVCMYRSVQCAVQQKQIVKRKK